MEVDVRRIATSQSHLLRHSVLRPHLAFEAVVWEGDDDPVTATFGAMDRETGAVVGVATVFPEPAPFEPSEVGLAPGASSKDTTWRLRGMATEEAARGRGIGSMVLEAAVDHVAAEGGELLWCNARIGAVAFYERAGFRTWGEVWDLPSVGPHIVMWRYVGDKGRP